MAVDLQLLESFGTTNTALRRLFESDSTMERKPIKGENAADKKDRLEFNRQLARDTQQRAKIQQTIQARNYEGIAFSLRDWRKYAAVDMAFDSSVITKTTLPLLLYAQGKCDVQQTATALGKCKNGDNYVKRDKEGKAQSIDIARFAETEFNLVRSIVLRRWSAQKNIFSRLWPLYDYEARGTSMVDKCRADVLSQRVDIMADQFGYRHHDEQVYLDGFLYGHSMDFPRCAWETEKQWRRIDNTKPVTEVDGKRQNIESVVVKEGLSFINPHPTRVFWDNSEPMSAINTDTGPQWYGYWDVVRYSDIEDNPYYFNKDKVTWPSPSNQGAFFLGSADFMDYANQYNFAINSPLAQVNNNSPAQDNDRSANMGRYTSTQRDASVFKTEFFERVVPNDIGVGTYPHPVWMRMVVASDNTVIFAEWMPSFCAAVLAINESDGRQTNVSMAMELLQYQQQLTNLITQLVNCLKIEAFKAIGVNIDAMTPEEAQDVKARLSSENWYQDPVVFLYSLAKLKQQFEDPQIAAAAIGNIITVTESKVSQSVQTIINSMVQLVAMVEKLFALSPAEQGQPAPREISATEANFVNNTTSSIYSSISGDVNKFRAAKKEIIYDSLMSCGKGKVMTPVKDRYTLKTITAAGFTPVKPETPHGDIDEPQRYTVIGSTRTLVMDYVFSSRDGDDRPTNTQAANTLVQLLGQFLSSPLAREKGAKSKVYMIMNDIFRQSGSGLDLNMEMEEGEDDSFGATDIEQLQQYVKQFEPVLQQLAEQTKKNAADVQQQTQVNEQQQQLLAGVGQLAEQVKTLALSHKQLQQLQTDGEFDNEEKAALQKVIYATAPEEIRAQIEQDAGLIPATKRTYTDKAPKAPVPTTRR